MSNPDRRLRLLISAGLLLLLGGLAVAIGCWWGARAGYAFIACGAAGMLAGRLSAPRPAALMVQLRQVGANLGRLFDFFTGHNLEHAVSFTLAGRRFYLCARCSGFAGGCLLGAGLTAWTSLPQAGAFVGAVLLALPLLADWATQTLGVHRGTSRRRFGTGLLAGVAVALFRQAPFGLGLARLLPAILLFAAAVYLSAWLIKKHTGAL
jgi:uncharacterized membrane protein